MPRASAAPRDLLPAFVFTSAALAIALGVSTGGWAIWEMAFAAGTVLPSHLQLHAHVQLVGFALLFVLGVMFPALPRMLDVPPAPRRVVLTVLVGVGGGALFRAIGQPLAPWAAGRLLSLLSGALELAGIFAFVAWAVEALATRREPGDPFTFHFLLGTAWAMVSAALSAAQAIFLAGHAESEIPGGLVEPFYAVTLYGVVLSWLFAFSSRVAPALLGLPGRTTKGARWVAALQGAGTLLLAAAWIRGIPPLRARALAMTGTLLVSAAVLLFLAASHLLVPLARPLAVPFLRVPFLFLGVFAATSFTAAVAEIGGASVHKFVWDGARHTYTIGFLTLFVVVMSLHVVPLFTGRTLARPQEARLAVVLVAAAAAVRALQIPVALGWGGLALYRLVGTTGIFATAGLVLWAHALVATLRRRPGESA
ncbi:MAG: NnrS family protein [Acidobacteriota bacterium]